MGPSDCGFGAWPNSLREAAVRCVEKAEALLSESEADGPNQGGVTRPDPTRPKREVLVGWQEIADYFGVSVVTVMRWARLYGLPVSRPGGMRNVIARISDLEAWIKAGLKNRPDPTRPDREG